jgi:NCAIR mutase (PurE)-related protein
MDDVPTVRPDFDREARTGIPEVVLAEGKENDDLRRAVCDFLRSEGRALVSRLAPERLPVLSEIPDARVRYHPAARFATVEDARARPPQASIPRGHAGAPPGSAANAAGALVGILAAGTSDRAVAEEAALVAEAMGVRTRSAYDVGVAGVHRLLPELSWAKACDVLIVIAGREGTLPTLVAGLVDVPVIGVPVSTGYGHAGAGEAALSSMLQSCSPLLVVNIDAGFVAGACAARIAKRIAAGRAPDADPAKEDPLPAKSGEPAQAVVSATVARPLPSQSMVVPP